MLEPGGRIGKYTLEARLGRGGGGEVWSAHDAGLGRRVALKFLRGEDPAELARFEREAKAAAGLSHPGIAAVYEVGVADGLPFIAMQLIDGGTLRAVRRDPREAVRCIRDAARALQFAHEHGVIHRDLKPDNLLVDAAGRVFVSDFGLARVGATGSTLTADGAVLGTPAYMPPEQARGDTAAVGVRSDVYSLGATLYHLLAGKPPFSGATPYEIITSVVNDEPPAPPGDPALVAVVLKCLEKNPARRYASMAALAEDLDRWLAGDAVSATLPSLRQRLGKRRGAVAAAGVLLGVAIVAGVVAWRTSATGDAATSMTVASLRQKADACLKAALDLRRSGNVAGMEQYANELKTACAAFAAADPASPEPHYLRGRMLRAQLQFGKAEQEQEAALARDPRHARARYERLIVRAHRVRFAISDAEAEGRRRLAGQAAEAVSVPLAAPIRELMTSVAAEAEALGGEPGLESGERLCARALGAWAAHRTREARDAAAAAVAAQAELDEAYQLLGDCEYELGRLDDAIAAYEAGSAADPGALTLRFSHAQRRYERARKASAVAELEAVERELGEVAALDTSARYALSLRADATMERARLTGLRGGDPAPVWRLAVERFEEALRLEPDEPGLSTGYGLALANEALRKMQTGLDPRAGFEAAIERLTRTVSLHPSYAAAWNGLGVSQMNFAVWRVAQGVKSVAEFEAAEAAFTKAVGLDPAEPRFVEWRAKARMNAGLQADDYEVRFRGALEDLARVPGSEATRGLVHYNWARRDARSGRDPAPRYRDALEALKGTEGAEALMARGNTKLALGRAEEADADFTAVIGANAAHDEAWAGRSRARAALKRFEEAEADGDRATQLNAKRAENWFALGMARRAKGVDQFRARTDPREAFRGSIEAFSRVLELNPADGAAMTNRASTRHALGKANEGLRAPALEDYRAALADYRKAVELDPAMEPKLRSVIQTCEKDIARQE